MASFARVVLAWPLVLLAACSDDPPFESLATLCADLAEDICDARAGGCCPVVDPMTCVDAERAQCQTQLDALTEESLRYSATEAAAKRRAARAQLDGCGAPPALASFFAGGLADGASCERDTQCSGGSCTTDTRQCAPALIALCTMP